MTAFIAIYRLVVRRLLTRSRAFAFGVVIGVMGVVGFFIDREAANPAMTTVRVLASLGLLLVVPLVCLIIATSAIGEWLEDETLVYVWLRPIPRFTLAVAPWLAAITVALPMNLLSTLILAAMGSGFETKVMMGAAAASAVATFAYCSLFVCTGAWTKRALVLNFGYVFVWEGLTAQYGAGFARLTVRSYSVSVLSDRAGVPLQIADRAMGSVLVMLVIVVIGGLALTTQILRNKDVP